MCNSRASRGLLAILATAGAVNGLALNAVRVDRATRSTSKGVPMLSTSYSGPTLENFPFRYATNITLNGQNLQVVIDTGSSDLWIAPRNPLNFDNTGISATISFVTSQVSGPVGLAEVELGGYSFGQQAFINATEVGLVDIPKIGLDGLIGFAFDGTSASAITDSFVKAGKSATAGQPFLFNVFDQNPSVNNFIGISLSRTGDLEDSADASLTINEFDERYEEIAQTAPILLFPPGNARWSLALDGVTVDGTAVPIPPSTVAGTPAGKLAILMDTGTPTATIPADLLNAIYSHIPGAEFSISQNLWIVPCNTTSSVAVILGGRSFALHPLDLSDVQVIDGVTVCTATPSPVAGNADFDALFGDTIMRNIYSVFNFGSAIAKSPSGSSSMQLLSQTNASAAAVDVISVRMANLANGPPEGVPTSFQPLGDPPAPSSPGTIANAALFDASGSTSNSADGDPEMHRFAEIIIALLGANLLIVTVLAVGALVVCVKRRGKAGQRRGPEARYVPVLTREHAGGSESYNEDKRYAD